MSGEQGYANPAALVSTQWVADHLNDSNVRLLEVDVDTSAYGQGHWAAYERHLAVVLTAKLGIAT